MEVKLLLFCVMSLLVSLLCQAGSLTITLCPEDYSPPDGCVTLEQLLSDHLIKSDTTFRFVPATFRLLPGVIIKFVNVSNIILDTAGPQRASITCVGENSGFNFHNVSGLLLQNMQFVGCAAEVDVINYNDYSATLALTECSDIAMQNITLKRGKGCGIFVTNIYGYFTISNALIYEQGFGLSLHYSYNASEFSHLQNPNASITCQLCV